MSEGDKYDDNNRLLVGNSVTNAIFHFSKGAPILEVALQILEKVYRPQSWASGGPDVLQRSLLLLVVIIFLSKGVATLTVEMSLWNTVMVEAALLPSFYNFSGVDVMDLLFVRPGVPG